MSLEAKLNTDTNNNKEPVSDSPSPQVGTGEALY